MLPLPETDTLWVPGIPLHMLVYCTWQPCSHKQITMHYSPGPAPMFCTGSSCRRNGPVSLPNYLACSVSKQPPFRSVFQGSTLPGLHMANSPTSRCKWGVKESKKRGQKGDGGGGNWGYAAYRAPPTSLGQPDTLLDNISACRTLGNPARPPHNTLG